MAQQKKKEGGHWMATPGFLLMGMGIGFLTDNLVAFMFIGLGLGLLISGMLSKFWR